MPEFNYKARTQDGDLQVGKIEAKDREAAADILSSHDLFVLSIEPIEEERWYDRILGFFKRVKTKDLMVFTRQFSTLLSAQVPLSDSLRSLYKQTSNPVLKEAIGEIAKDIDAGFSLSQALERQGSIFSDFYINMVKSAEATGRLNEVLGFLADYLEKRTALVSKVRNALIYPAFVIVLFVIVVILMLTLVLPQITPIFEEAGVDLPFYTKIVIALGEFMSQWWWILGVIFGAMVLAIIDYFQTEEGQVVKDELMLRIPLFGGLFKKMYVARFAESARVLIRGGLTIPQAVEVSANTIGNSIYKNLLSRAADKVRKGEQLSDALRPMDEFPPLVSQLIDVGEQTGKLDKLLEKVNDFYTREVEEVVNNLVSLIQPALMVVIGILVAFLFASILMPLYSLSNVL
ncbi:MAG: type II secretion system F family protein [Candidatus Magasanikbacteria bacterium]